MNALVERINDLQSQLDGLEGNNMAALRKIVNMDVRETDKEGHTQLHLLLYSLKLDQDVVKDLLDLGVPVNAETELWKTPLHYALKFKNCNLPIIKLLVTRGADVNKSDYSGFGPLTYALWNDHCSADVIEFLCDNGADVKVVDKSRCTLLHHASKNRKLSLEVFKMLLDKGVSAHAVNMHGETALHVAVIHNCKAAVGLLLNIPKIKVNLFNKQRRTPLHLAVSNPKIDHGIIKLLLEAGAITEKKTHKDRQCLHLAAQHCNPTHIKLLLDYGARVNVLDKNKLSPLYIAVNKSQNCNIAALKSLLDAGALIFLNKKLKKKMNPHDECPINATTALHEAVRVLDIENKRSNKGPHKTQQVLLLLKYAALEKPSMCFHTFQADSKITTMLTDYYKKCMEELKTVCIAPNVTLAQFILRSSLQEDGTCPINDILEILSAGPYPIYKEVAAGLMDRDDLRDGLQQHPVYASNENKPGERAVLDYDTLCGVMIYLSEKDLLNLLLAVFEPRRSFAQVKRCCDCGINEDIEAESEKFHKRARIL